MMPIKNLLVQTALIVLSIFSNIAYAVDSDFDTLPDEWEVANNRNPAVADYIISTRPFLNNSSNTHVCSIDDVGVKCWGGDNGYGQLNVPSELSNPTDIAVGNNHTCAIDDSGVRCWGSNSRGQIDVPDGIEKPRTLSLGPEHSCVIDDVGVKCWGGTTYNGESNVPDTISNPTVISANHYATCAIDDNGATCWGKGFQGNNDIPDGLVNPRDISIGIQHGCALDDNGVKCWGRSLFGKTDVPDDLVNPIMVEAGYYNSCAIDDNGLQCWGTDAWGINDIPQGLSEVIDVAISYKHACALSSAGVTCWGKPDNGQDIVPELNFDPDNDGVDSSIDELPLDPTESVDTDKDGIGDNKDLVNDLFDGKFWEVTSSNFRGTIVNGVLSSSSQISVLVKNTSNQTVDLNSFGLFNMSNTNEGSTSDSALLGDDGRLSPNESFGITLTTRSSQSFPLKWRLNFVNPNTGVNQEFSVLVSLNSTYAQGNITLNAIGSTSKYFSLAKDSDDDGVIDGIDIFPRNPSESEDSDDDGLGNNYEITYGLDPYNADSDNDGVSDLADIFPLDNTKTTILDDDSVPVVTAPNDIYADAINILTSLDIGQAFVRDNLEILIATSDKTGPFPSGETLITWSATDSAGNQGTAQQSIFIRPFVAISPVARVEKIQNLSFTVRLSGNAVTYPVLVPVRTNNSLVNLSTDTLEFTSGSEAPLSISIDDITALDSFSIIFDEPSNAFLGNNSIMEIAYLEGDLISPYEMITQPVPEFEKMTPTAKVIVTSSEGDNFFNIARHVDDVSVVGQTFLVSGSSEVDGVMIQPGVKYDLTNLKGSIDKLYFSGSLSEYADSILLDNATGVMQLSRWTDIGEEVVQFIATSSASDLLVFLDGALSAADVKAAIASDTSLTDLTLDTTINTLDDKATMGATVKHIVLDDKGAGVMALGPNITTLISGSSGVDQIYIPAGSNVDASNLKSGQDEIYLQGNFADYTSEFDSSGNIVLSRYVVLDDESQTERVVVANGGNVATNDLVIFNDQQVDTATLKLQVLN